MRAPSALFRILGIAGALPLIAASASALARQTADTPSADNFGSIGLVETPTARMMPAGSFEIGVLAANPYRRIYALMQLLDWLEVDFRYTDITNVLQDGTVISPADRDFLKDLFDFNGTGTVRDRGFDLKLRLSREGRFMPAIAIGLQDMFGRARFGGEYVVASKRVGAFDFHLGIGWGYFGSRDQFGNPLSVLGNSFRRREFDPGRGTFNFGSYFSGSELALFGGVEWFTPLAGLSLKADYSGADPAREPLGNRLDEDLPFNFALTYRPRPWLDIGLGFLRGNTVMARTAVRFDLFDPPRLFDSARHLGELPDAVPDGTVASEPEAGPSQPVELRLRDWLERQGMALVALHLEADAAALRLGGDAPDSTTVRRLADGLFALLPDRAERLWLAWQGEPNEAARLFLRDSEPAWDAARIAAVLGESGSGAVIRLSGRRLEIEVTGPDRKAERALPADVIAALPRDIESLRWRHGARVLDEVRLGPLRPAAEAEAILAAIDGLAVEEIRLEGRGLLEVTTHDDIRLPALDRKIEQLGRRAGVARVLIAEGGEGATGAMARNGVAAALFEKLAREGMRVRAISLAREEATIWLADAPLMPEAQVIGRAARHFSELLSASVARLTVARTLGDAELYRVSFLRRDLQAAIAGRGSPEEIGIHRRFDATGARLGDARTIVNEKSLPRLSVGVAPVLLQHVGNPRSGVYLADFDVDFLARAELLPGLFLSAAVRRFVVGNLDHIEDDGPSSLPRVRSDIRRYVEAGRTAIPYLEADYIFPLTETLLARLSAGLFEPMYGGVGGELLYHEKGARWALGGEINWVKQRDFDQLFDFRGYDTVTGDVSLYTEWAQNVRGIVRFGRFLAGDWGASIDLSRGFANGVRVGAFLTTTSDVRNEFGVDNLDKGVYITVPFGALWPYGGPREVVGTTFRALTRDSGQRLELNERLYDLVARQQRERILQTWGHLLD